MENAKIEKMGLGPIYVLKYIFAYSANKVGTELF